MPFTYKIHPGIGVARVGDSPSDWFIGPETIDLQTPPYGGYRDAQGRVKRQAGRFRLFRYNGPNDPNPTLVPGSDVTWTVELGPAGGNTQGTVQGSNRSLPLPKVPFSGGSPSQVSWGEIRTDAAGNLVVLGGVVEDDFEATGNGRVTAIVNDPNSPSFVGSWVLLLPPTFVPYKPTKFSVYDMIVQAFALRLPPYSFMNDIYPILQLFDIPDTNLPAGSPQDQLKVSISSAYTYPALSSCGLGTASQSDMVTKWKQPDFVNDWVAPPPPRDKSKPPELDRGPLAYVSAGGWDLGSGTGAAVALVGETTASDRMRIDGAKYPTTKARGAINWRTDVCGIEWPAWDYANGVPQANAEAWKTRGFVVRQAGKSVYVEDATPPGANVVTPYQPYVLLLTPTLQFGDVPQGSSPVLGAIVFEVGSQTSSVSFSVGPLPSGLVATANPTTVPAMAAGEIQLVHVPIQYTVGANAVDVTVSVTQGADTYAVRILANPVPAVATQVVFLLDFSASMGGGTPTKVDLLRQALAVFEGVKRAIDGLAAVAFNHGILGTFPAPNYATLADFALAFNPGGYTSIGGAMQAAVALFDPAYARHALVAVTDGIQTTPPSIDTAMQTLAASSTFQASRIFAVGLGGPKDVDTAELQVLSGNTGGYLLLTGDLTQDPGHLILSKYFLQILANVSNLQVILDPPGSLVAGRIERIAFSVTEFDRAIQAMVLTERSDQLAVLLQAPDGTYVTPETISGFPGNAYGGNQTLLYYRVRLPLLLANAPAATAGIWHLVLTRRRLLTSELSDELIRLVRTDARVGRAVSMRALTVPDELRYEAIVHADSDLAMTATLQQVSLAPGEPWLFEVLLNLQGAPFGAHAHVTARIEGPSGHPLLLELRPEGSGRYVGRFEPVRPGLYRAALIAEGRTPLGHRFRREQIATAAVLAPKPGCTATDSTPSHGCDLCRLLACMLDQDPAALWADRLRSLGIDAAALRKKCCRPEAHDPAPPRAPAPPCSQEAAPAASRPAAEKST